MYWRLSLFVIIVLFGSSCAKKLTYAALTDDQLGVYNDIKQSYLVVRIPTQGRKIKVLKERLATTTNGKILQNLRSEIQRAEDEDKEFSQELMSAFHGYYTFTPFVFVADTLFKRFLDGDNSVFLDRKGKQTEIKDFNRDKYYLILQGAQKEQLRFMDKYSQPTPIVPIYKHILSKIRELQNRQRFMQRQVNHFDTRLKYIESAHIEKSL